MNKKEIEAIEARLEKARQTYVNDLQCRKKNMQLLLDSLLDIPALIAEVKRQAEGD